MMSKKIKIVADSGIPYIEGVLEPWAGVVRLEGSAISPADVADADALIIRTRTRCNAALLEGSRVKLIATATIGYDHIDTAWCAAAGIRVATAAGSNARGVLQWVAAALACASSQQEWAPQQKSIGVVGVGNVGSLVARYADMWGFRVLCCDPPRRLREERPPAGGAFVSLDELLSECDIVTFHTPLSHEGADATFHMADARFFERLREGALVLNSARGEVVDTAALKQSLKAGRCSAAIDTWEGEPHIDAWLLEHSLVATPHIAGYSAQGKANAAAMSVRTAAAFFGLPLTEWYPGQVAHSTPRDISWAEMCGSIAGYFDIAAQSRTLKEAPADFEKMRDNYRFRTEYF